MKILPAPGAYKTLYRAVGLPEWRLITADGRRRFPPETLSGDFYYPALTFAGACAAARDVLANYPSTEYTGLVAAFDVPPDSLGEYEKIWQNTEMKPGHDANLWIGCVAFRELNRRITGVLRICEAFYGSQRPGGRFTPQELNESGFLG